MDRPAFRDFGVVGLALALVFVSFASAFSVAPTPLATGPTPDATTSFTFAAVGDLGGPGVEDMVSLAKRTATAGASFLIALGDLGYTSDEAGWCSSIKGAFNDIEVIAGNHDSGESSGGAIANFVVECPFTLGVPVTAGPGTPGYGYEYYFDYPSATPLVRFILVTAGLSGTIGYDYSAGSTHFNWVVDAVNGARANGIPWVAVGAHKLCINAGRYGCEIGQDLFDKLVDLKVDLILGAHYHTYQRSKQLALSPACTTVPAENSFDADCIVDDGSDDLYTKGAGSLVIVSGAGGNSLYDIAFDGSDPEINYMAQAMGGNQNSRGLSEGHGPVLFTVTATGITSETDLCLPGSTDSSGQCPSTAASTFWDRFTIGSPPAGPFATFSFAPSSPQPGEPVTFDATGSTDSDPGATLQARWDWEDDGTWDTSLSSTLTAQHAFASTGTYTVRLEIHDSNNLTANATRQVVVLIPGVDTTPPVTTASPSGTTGSGGWYTSAISVTLTSSDGESGVADIYFQVDGGGWSLYSAPVDVSGDGSHTVEYYAADNAGNVEGTRSLALDIDGTPPSSSATVAGTQAGDGSYVSSAVVTLSSSDGTSGVRDVHYRINGGSLRTYSGPFAVSGNGTHDVEYYATDNAGNDEGTRTLSFRVSGSSHSAPVTSMTVSGTLGMNGWYTSQVWITFLVAGESGATITTEVRVDAGTWTTYVIPFLLGEGRHVLDYQSADDAGYVESAKSATVDVDATRPSFEAASPSGSVSTPDVPVSWAATDAVSGVLEYEVSVDGGPFVSVGTETVLTQRWSDGRHSIAVRAVDAAGNEALTAIDFTVDRGPFATIGIVGWIPVLAAPLALLGILGIALYVRRRRARRRDTPDFLPEDWLDL